MRHHLISGVLLAMIMATGLASAQTYKWTDADGKVHYSDQPPPANAKEQGTVKQLKPSAPPPAAASAPTEKGAPAAKTPAEQEADFKKRQVEAAEREAAEKQKAAEAEQKRKYCESARAALKNFEIGGRFSTTNAQGERDYLTDAQIAQQTARLKQSVDSACK
jgi:hypothetical protein